MNKRLALVVLIFYIGMPAIGQFVKDMYPVRVLEIPIHQYTPAEGLSQGFTSSVAVDNLGYLWITTKEGLNRFDGRTFKKFTHSAKDPSSLAENYVTSLLAIDDKIWVGTYSGKLDCLDVSTEKFTHINLKGSNEVDFKEQNIPSIIPGGKDKVIADLGNRYKIIEYKKQPNGIVNFSVTNIEDEYPILKRFSQEMLMPKKMILLPDGKLYIQIGDSVFLYSSKARTLLYAFERSIRDVGLYLISWKNPVNNEIFLAAKDRLLKYDSSMQKFVQCMQLPQPYFFSNYIFSDKEGRIWSQTKDRSFLRIDIAKNNFDIIKLLEPGVEGLGKMADINFTSEATDAVGNIWFGSNGYGIIKLSPSDLYFKKINEAYNNILSAGWQLRFSQKGHNATYNKGIIDRYLQLLERSDVFKRIFQKSEVDEHFALDDDGNYWFNLLDKKKRTAFIIKMNGNTGAHTIVLHKNLDNEFGGFQPIYCDRQNKIWACESTSSKTVNIYCLDAKSGQQLTYTLPRIQTSYAEGRVITDIENDAEGNIWFASNMGLFKLSPHANTWTSIQEGKNSFATNKLLSLCEDPAQSAKYLWIGSEGGGLYKLDKRSGKITEFTTANGLPNNVIYSIQPDAHNNLWLSTNNGICLFNPATISFTNFNKSHGLEGLEFNRYQFSKSLSGEMYLGGVGFDIHFNPEDFYRQKSSAKMVINGLKVNNKDISLNEEKSNQSSILQQAVEFTTKLVLPYDQSMVSLRFNLLDLTNPTSNRYRYKLAGLNDKWIDIGTNNEAVFTNLPPGDYTFYASGHTGDGIWSEPAEMSLQILPAWWQTWWFKLLLILIIVSLLYFFVKYRFKKALEVEKIRNRIAQDLHDEIGSTLSSVGIYSAALSKTIHSKPENAQNILDKISTSATNMMESMSDIVWSVNPSNDSISTLLARMRSFASSVAESANVTLHFETNMGESKKPLSMIDRKNLYLIFKEAVANALKHSGCGNLWVNLDQTGKQVILQIRDDGRGFEPQSKEKVGERLSGNGMNNMRTRAKESKSCLSVFSKENEGTTIEFILEK